MSQDTMLDTTRQPENANENHPAAPSRTRPAVTKRTANSGHSQGPGESRPAARLQDLGGQPPWKALHGPTRPRGSTLRTQPAGLRAGHKRYVPTTVTAEKRTATQRWKQPCPRTDGGWPAQGAATQRTLCCHKKGSCSDAWYDRDRPQKQLAQRNKPRIPRFHLHEISRADSRERKWTGHYWGGCREERGYCFMSTAVWGSGRIRNSGAACSAPGT